MSGRVTGDDLLEAPCRIADYGELADQGSRAQAAGRRTRAVEMESLHVLLVRGRAECFDEVSCRVSQPSLRCSFRIASVRKV